MNTQVRELINMYQSVSLDLGDAIQKCDADAVKKLDGQVSSIFDDILSYAPSATYETETLATFLLETLVPPVGRTRLEEGIIKKVISLIN